jgi:hypothetical protein
MEAERWTREHPVGTEMCYSPVSCGPRERVRVRSEAWTLGHGAVVVKVTGHTGGVSVAHLEEAEVGSRG